MKTVIVMICMAGLLPLAFTQSAMPPRMKPSDAKDHIGETATVCGNVVDTKISENGIAGRGKPVRLYLNQPEPNREFYFVAFGAQPGGFREVIAAYQGKRVCVTGKITGAASGPFIMAADRSQIKGQAEDK